VGLTLTVLGCSGSYPGPGGACSGYLVRDSETTVWLDCGSGTMANLQRHVALDDVDAVVLSHEHPDHWRDLEGLYVAYRYGPSEREGIPVYAPSGLRDQTYFDTEPVFSWRTIADGHEVGIGSMSWSFSRTDHGPETLAARVESGGRSLAYTADTGAAWSLERFNAPIDLALSESTLRLDEENRTQHLSGRQAGAMAAAVGAGQLVLTHVWPEYDPADAAALARTTFDGPVATAAVGEEYVI
jgi:ribonuclease BN (tRNA processing enzyme)